MEKDIHGQGKAISYSDFLRREDRSFILWRLTRTPELEDFWHRYIKDHPEERFAFDRAVEICDSMALNQHAFADKEQLFMRIQHTIAMQKQRRMRRIWLRRIVAAAAVFLLLIIPTVYYFFETGKDAAGESISLVGEIRDNESIGLIIEGKEFVLQDSADVRITNGRVLCNGRDLGIPVGSKKNGVCRMIVPAGKHSFLTLADLTKVWINSGTKVDFTLAYGDKSRDIRVDGEIFIDVAKNQNKPFVVHTERLDVLVHGTSFNVSAYGQEDETSVVLVEGSVQVTTRDNRHVDINPNQRVALSESRLEKVDVDVTEYVSWKNGYLVFNDASMGDVLDKLGRYYNIRFGSQTSRLSQRRITGKLYLASDIDEILTAVSLITSTTYTRDNNNIKFSEKRKETTPMED